MFILVLNSTNILPDGQNNKLIYKFPNSVNLTDKYIALSSVSMYYSWDNISVGLSNNILYYSWDTGITGKRQIQITIPDGLYEISQLNEYLQFVMIQNGTYWYDALAPTVFYYPFEIQVNATRYAIQLNTFTIPRNSDKLTPNNTTVYTCGSGSVSAGIFPINWQNPVVQFPPNFNAIVGYLNNYAGSAILGQITNGFFSSNNFNNTLVAPAPNKTNNYIAKNTLTGTISYLSDTSPQVQPNSNVLFSMSNINNPYGQPSNIIYSIAPTVAIGEQIVEKPPNFLWTKMINGTYNELRLTFLGNNLSPLVMRDPNMTILLSIRDKDEAFLGTK